MDNNTSETKGIALAIEKLASAIMPSGAVGIHDETGTFVASHVEAMIGLTAATQSIANAINNLAEAVRGTRDE